MSIEAPSRPSFVLDDDEVDGLGRGETNGGSARSQATHPAHPATSDTPYDVSKAPQQLQKSTGWSSWLFGPSGDAKAAGPQMTWRESLWQQWETGTGLFGPLIPEPTKEQLKEQDRERQQQTWQERPKRPGLVSRLSSAVSMTLYPPRPRSESQPQQPER